MEFFDTGLFLIISVLAFAFMVLSFRYLDAGAGSLFFLFACIMFLSLSLILVSEIPIQSDTTITDGSNTWTETNTLISGSNGFILGLFYMVFGILNAGLLAWKLMPVQADW